MDDSLKVGSSVYSKYTSSYIDSEKNTVDSNDTNSYMSFDSYLKLLTEQMRNQDFNNPMDDSEVLAQMAQYSMLEGIKNMTQQSSISYATTLVGQVVTVDDGSGAYTGMVESVTVRNGEPWLMIDGMSYKSDKVTDIVDVYTFRNLMELIGKTVQAKGEDSETAVTGVVTNVLYQGGEGYVVVKDKLIPVDRIEIVDDPDDPDDPDGSDKTEGADKTEGSENAGNSNGDGSTEENSNVVTETAEAETDASMSYMAKSESLIDTFMRELDEAGGVSAVSKVSETNAAENVTEEYYVEIMELEVPDYSAGIYADDSVITGSVSSNSDRTLGSGSGTLSRGTESKNASSSNNYSANYSNYNSYSNYGGYKGVTTSKGVSTGDCVPHRISVEAYPEEAALADSLGTRMYDIRFINNHAITSRIKTDEVIGHSSSGKPVTEIGYSGVGQLGEVVTFADGTQRVEILLQSGHSGWLTTSGNLTLDEICSKKFEPNSLTGRLTPEESAIRHFSDPMSEMDQSLRVGFNRYLRMNGV